MNNKIKLLFLSSLLIANYISFNNNYARADSDSLIEELSQDSSFSIDDYQLINDKSKDMQFIDFKISTTNIEEAVVYFYNPTGLRTVKKISIDYGTNGLINEFINYDLDLIDQTSNKALQKYLIKNFIPSTNYITYYRFGAFQRDCFADEIKQGTMTYSTIGLTAGLQFKVTIENEEYFYERSSLDTIRILDPFCGFMFYQKLPSFIGGLIGYNSAAVSNYIAFNTDKPIDQILEISIDYSVNDFETKNYISLNDEELTERFLSGQKITYSNPKEITNEIIYASDIGIGRSEYKRIQLVSDLSNKAYPYYSESDDKYISTIPEVQKCKWILRFRETKYEWIEAGKGTLYSEYIYEGNIARNVQILRLKYRYNEKVYNLAAIDSIKSGSLVTSDKDNQDWLQKFLIAVITIVVIVSLAPQVLSGVATFAFVAVAGVAKRCIKIIKMPYKAVKKLFSKKKRKKY